MLGLAGFIEGYGQSDGQEVKSPNPSGKLRIGESS